MLLIRSEQIGTLEQVSLRSFEDRAYAHLKRYFPRHCDLLGETQVRKVVPIGLRKSIEYGLSAESCVQSYIDFMCLLGSGFDNDPLLPWAADVLNDRSNADPIERGDDLYDRGWAYIQHIVADYRDAQGRPTTARFVEEIRALRGRSGKPINATEIQIFSNDLFDRIVRVLPAKAEYVGEERIRLQISRSIEAANGYSITSERGLVLFCVLKIMLGDGFDRDPLLPWASKVLNDETISDQSVRVDRLLAEGVGFLNRWWDSAPERKA